MNDEWLSLHEILRQLYEEMLPLCGSLIGVARGIAGLGAIFYIANRVWRHMANNEPIDFYPLLRPFAIGWCILLFPLVIGALNGILNPVATATGALVDTQNVQVREFQEQLTKLEEASMKKEGKGWMVDDAEFEKKLEELNPIDVGGMTGMYTERAMYQLQTNVREWFKEVLIVLYEAASLVLDTIRTFFLIVMAIIGPISFGLAVFDGFHGTLTNWIARYINVFLWLPVANIFGAIISKINVLMLQKDIADLQSGGDFDATNTAYLVFLLIGIFGYTCVPTVAGWIVQSCGGGRFMTSITHASSSVVGSAGSAAGAGAGAIAGRSVTAAKNLANAPSQVMAGYQKL
ncbi:conjugative transposon protein TraJ [Rufibacter latericius]|uniref:Conjugative transposon protein TraJ n=1 Tax=Rufibacter latericius TaxID=2487040 RepID=A0A3M9MF44_9BACT|nr:conjugative transposon protein TraJ [Rufibacter latericius]RNI24114.1 conjugative transposon protein TraJ [Rufibacter latericius]